MSSVYDISILANIPLSVFDLLDPSAPVQRLRPLFTIGVHDIPFLVEDHAASKRSVSRAEEALEEDGSGWVACTTDSILAMKEDLWDVLITMPPNYSINAKERVWPTVERPKGVPLKATQRDLRRLRSLKAGLDRLAKSSGTHQDSPRSEAAPSTTQGRPSTSSGRSTFLDDDPALSEAAEKIVEPVTWAALAYSGFMWWASAGEQRRSEEAEEAAQDATLLADLAPPMPQRTPSMVFPGSEGMMDSVSSLTARRGTPGGNVTLPNEDDDERARVELAIIAYFHRLTTQMLMVLADIVDRCDDDDDDMIASGEESENTEEALLPSDDGDISRGGIRVDSDALNRMNLDIWSQADADFIKDFTMRYFSRRAVVEGKGVEVCGLRVC